MPDVLLKRWNDWSAGIGHLVDDGRTPGMYYASGLLGLRGELRPAPFFNVVTTGLVVPVSRYSFSNITLTRSHAAIALLPASAAVQITVNAGGAFTGKVAANAVLTVANVVVDPASDSYLVVTVHNDSAASPTGVTYDGNAMTLIAEGLGNPRTSIWGRALGATNTTGNVVVTFAGATDIIASAQGYDLVDQAAPIGTGVSITGVASTGFSVLSTETGAEDYGMLVDACVIDDVTQTATPDKDQTSILDDTEGGNIDARASYAVVADVQKFHFQYFAEAVANTDAEHPFLYVARGHRFGGGYAIHKIDLENATFGTCEAGYHTGMAQLPGQPAKYQGFWWWPGGNDSKARQLSVVGTGAVATDTLTAPVSPHVAGADHLAVLGDQVVGVVKEGVAGVPGLGGVGAQPGGVRILKVDGDPANADHWGSAFPVGETTERAAGLITMEGAAFVLNVDGLYSFNNKSRSRLVFEDFRQWRNIHSNIPMSARGGGLMILHPTGALFFAPGEQPVNVGVDKAEGLRAIPPSGVTELHGGLYHSATTIGDYEYSVYQPDLTSTNVLILCDYPRSDDPRELVWQVLGTTTLQDIEAMLGVHAATSGRPLSANHVTPTVWFGDGADLNYVVLDGKAGPFRSRSDTHKVNISADAYMSELFFAEPVELTRLVVHTSADMADGDEWQISIIPDGTGRDENVGRPIKGSGIRHERKLDRHSVSRMVLRVNWAATSAADRVPPVITRIDLYGGPEKGMASAARPD